MELLADSIAVSLAAARPSSSPFDDEDFMAAHGYRRELEVAIAAAQAAGELLRREFYRPGGPRGARGKCPADNEAEALIRKQLSAAFPEYGQRGEELAELDRDATNRDTPVWLIDPNDGTSSFQQGWRGSSVSLGLVRDGVPVLGVVFAYNERAGRGELFTWAEGLPFQRNGREVSCPVNRGGLTQGTVLTSQDGDLRVEANLRLVAPARFRGVPSIAYRLALVAAGDGVATMSFSGPTDWDVAAGHALLRAAGGELYRMDGTGVRYHDDGSARVGNCWAGDPTVAAELIPRNFAAVLYPRKNDLADYSLTRPDPQYLVADSSLLDRAQGCLLGQLAGDNLGALVEFQSPEQIRARFPEGPRELIDGGYWDLLAGQPTDDSELALLLARSILKEGQYTDEAAARAYAWWLGSNPFDVGRTTWQALSPAWNAYRSRQPLAPLARQASSGSASQANGGLMRISPLGIFGHAFSEDDLADMARQDSQLTHAHPVCQDASAIYCVAIAAAVRGVGDGHAVYRHACDWGRRQAVHPEVLAAMDRAADRRPADYLHSMGWVLTALQNAFYQLLHAGNLVDGLADTVLCGGDTDTNAAIAGALLGAVRGTDALPSRWIDRLVTCRPLANAVSCSNPRPAACWPVDCLIVAEQLAALGILRADGKGVRTLFPGCKKES